ncbi:MAG: hypothetical protein AABN33_08490 [Acidobacteriota bacterium]
MRRRIEITVYRRATVAFQGCPKPESKGSEPFSTVSAQEEEADIAEAQLTTVDVARSPELTLLIEALVKNDGDSARAARHLGLSRSDFISKLCGLGFATKQ